MSDATRRDPIPEELMAAIGRLQNGYYGFRCWATALQSGLIGAIGERADTAENLAKRAGTDARATARVLDALVSVGLLRKEAEGSNQAAARYALEPGLEIFAKNASSFGRHLQNLEDVWIQLGAALASGKPARRVESEGSADFFANFVRVLFETNRRAAEIAAAALAPGLTREPAPRALDIGAGSGIWSLMLAEKVPALKVTALDHPPVLAITRQVFAEYGAADRLSVIEGDHRQVDLGTDVYDAIFLGHLLHSEGRRESAALIARCARALRPAGKLVIGEFIADEARASREQPRPLLFAVNMLLVSADGDAFTLSEMREWLSAAGLTEVETLEVPGTSPVIVAGRPSAG
jgi:precorrin-6B methylase 2